MTLEQIEKDLANCNDFSGVCLHTFKEQTEELNYLCFDEHSEVIFDNDYSRTSASVPSFTFATSQTKNITNKSTFDLNGDVFGVIQIENKSDYTTTVFLDRK